MTPQPTDKLDATAITAEVSGPADGPTSNRERIVGPTRQPTFRACLSRMH
jgi:hypothetical protein